MLQPDVDMTSMITCIHSSSLAPPNFSDTFPYLDSLRGAGEKVMVQLGHPPSAVH